MKLRLKKNAYACYEQCGNVSKKRLVVFATLAGLAALPKQKLGGQQKGSRLASEESKVI